MCVDLGYQLLHACQVTIDLFFVFALHLKALHAIKSVDFYLKFSLSSSSSTVLIRCRYMSRGSYLHFILNRGWQCVSVEPVETSSTFTA